MVIRRVATLATLASIEAMNMQWSNLFCPCERSEIGEGVEKDRKYAVFLPVPPRRRARRDSTNGRNAYGTNTLLNIGANVINSLVDFSTPQSRTARQLPYIAPQHRGAKGYLLCHTSRRATTLVARASIEAMNMQWSNLFCPCERSEIGEVPQGEGVKKDRKDAVFLSVPASRATTLVAPSVVALRTAVLPMAQTRY